MSQDVVLILAGACGFALLSMLLGIFMYQWFRRMIGRFFIVGIVNKIIGDTKEEVDDVESVDDHRRVTHLTREEMEAKAEALDFDAALARRHPSPEQPLSAQTAPPDPPEAPPLRPNHPENEPRRLLRDDDEPDDTLYGN